MKGWLAELEAASSAGRGERGERFSLQPCLGRYLLHQRVQNSKGRAESIWKELLWALLLGDSWSCDFTRLTCPTVVLMPYDLGFGVSISRFGISDSVVNMCSWGLCFPHVLHAAAGLGTWRASKYPAGVRGWSLPCCKPCLGPSVTLSVLTPACTFLSSLTGAGGS